jgi:hypothetical protein
VRLAVAAPLAVILAACNAPGATHATGGNQADAVREKLLPCSVQAHGFGDVLRDAPEPAECDDSVDVQTIPLDQLIRILPDQHPAFYYTLAARLFAANRRDEAVFWFYAGQLRYRIRLSCHPRLRPDIEPALFGSLQETVGRQINEYGFGDPPALAATLDRVLAWDAATHNGFEPKAACAAPIARERGGLGQLIRHVRENGDDIRRQRTANGLPNR